MISKNIFVILFIICICKSELHINEPIELVEELHGNSIPYKLTPFGDIPYSQTITGDLVLADPIDACSYQQKYYGENEHRPIVLLVEGGCSITEKLYNVQKAGASVAIIQRKVSDIKKANELHTNKKYEFEIPSISIGKDFGELLQQYQEQEDQYISLSLTFKKNNNDTLKLFIDVRDLSETSKFVTHFSNTYMWYYAFDISVYYYLTETSDRSQKKKCYGNGRYCLDSTEQLDEIIFQTCLLKIDNKMFFQYYKHLEEYFKIYYQSKTDHDDEWKNLNDVEKDQSAESYSYHMREVILPMLLMNFKGSDLRQKMKIQDCINSSFQEGVRQNSQNGILDESVYYTDLYEIQNFPSAVINNKEVSQEKYHKIQNKKSTYASYVLYQICKNAQSRTYKCSQYIYNFNQEHNIKSTKEDLQFYDENSGLSVWWIIFIIVSSFSFVGLIFGLWYKRRMNQYLELESEKMESLVQNYYNLHKQSKKDIEEKKQVEEEQKENSNV